uniref:Uncharacterized protein n=1 Tax=Tanacetum cinerariifolium TaxID=118510 RepID=A0A699TWP9_TANCI|nr:hypothetical protein [Tanacetum cinerariifolium]
MGVSIAPGSTALMRSPLGLPSMADERVSDSTAALAAAYGATSASVSTAWMLDTFTTLPPGFMCRNACLVK